MDDALVVDRRPHEGPFQGLLDGLFADLLPGDERWPRCTHALAIAFWRGWYAEAPALTRWGLVGCAVLLRTHGWLAALRGRRSAAERLQAAHDSPLLPVQQALAVAKAVAGLAYFSHEGTQALARQRTVAGAP